jgi:F-type H+-transporting ATPase subunit epsilon
MGKLQLEIVTPEKVVLSKEVDLVVIPGAEGEFGVLEDHVSFLSAIIPGDLHFIADNNTEHFAVSYGFTEIFNNKVSVLVDSAEDVSKIDVERARKAMERAQDRLSRSKETDKIDVERAEAALRRARARLKAAEAQSN